MKEALRQEAWTSVVVEMEGEHPSETQVLVMHHLRIPMPSLLHPLPCPSSLGSFCGDLIAHASACLQNLLCEIDKPGRKQHHIVSHSPNALLT